MQVYLDYAATTPLDNRVRQAMEPIWTQDYGNPSSPHLLGSQAEKTLSDCRRLLAHYLNAQPTEIYFTGSGTEANNLAILGFALNQYRPGHIVTTSIEHASVLNPIKQLCANHGWQSTLLKVDGHGSVDLSELAASIRPETRLVSIMAVNNEIGSVQDLSQIREILTEKEAEFQHKIVFHSDWCQAGHMGHMGTVPGVSLLTLSGHKFGGPKGIGLLYCQEAVKLRPLIYGGGQENNLRPGTENLPGIVGFTKAFQLAQDNPKAVKKTKELKERLKRKLEQIPNCFFNSGPCGAPHILNLGFTGVKAEVLVHFLGEKGIYLAMGAACSSRKPAPSHVLQALGLTTEAAASSIRISLAADLSEKDIDYAAACIDQAVREIRTIYS